MTVMFGSGPLVAVPGWIGWSVMALVLVALWTMPIAGTLALFPGPSCDGSDRTPSGHD
jgi:hypothetical protein